jgi:hypothetical protein
MDDAKIGASVSNGVLKIAYSKKCKSTRCKDWSSTTVKIPKNELVNLQAYAATNLFVDGKLISNGQVKFASDSVSNVVISDLSGEYQQLDLSTKSAGGIYIQGSPTISKSSIQAQSASLVQAEVNSMKNLEVKTNGAGSIALNAKSDDAKFDSFIGTTEGASQAQLCSLQFANISANVAGAGSMEIGATTGATINGEVGGAGSLKVYASSSPDLSGVSTRGAGTAKFAYQATCKRKVIKAPMVLTIEELKERANDPKCQDIIIPDSGSSSDSGSNGASSTAVSGIVVMTMAMAVIGML